MKRNILITGAHRSGSTWAGSVIVKANKVRYIHEPFNIELNRMNSPLHYWFEYLDGKSPEYQREVKSYIDSMYKVYHVSNLYRIKKIRSLSALYNYLSDLKLRMTSRTVFKDPIALMSAEWMYKTYKIDIIVLIRHPAAFIASLKVKGWYFNFNQFKEQSGLMDTFLKDYHVSIEDFSKNKRDIIEQGILLWNVIHDTIDLYQIKYRKEWYFVKHEDLSLNPILEFKKMFEKIDLPFNYNIENYINETTKSKEQTELKRNSLENIKTWKERLSEDEIQRIKKGTEKVWKKFYAEKDW